MNQLQKALDDGQEIKMHRFWNPVKHRHEYYVRVCGDCHIEFEHSSLEEAVSKAALLYREWDESDEKGTKP